MAPLGSAAAAVETQSAAVKKIYRDDIVRLARDHSVVGIALKVAGDTESDGEFDDEEFSDDIESPREWAERRQDGDAHRIAVRQLRKIVPDMSIDLIP